MGGVQQMKRFFLMIFTVLFISAIAVGCGQGDTDKSKENEKSAEKAGAKDKKELSPEQVITKSSEAMNDWPGMDYKMNGQVVIHAKKGEEKQDITQDLNMESKVKLDPLSLQINGDITMEGQKVPVQSYYKDKTMYQEVPGQGWIAIEGMDFEALQENSQAQNPAEQMKQFTKIIKSLPDNDDKKNAYVEKSEEDGMYIITLNLDKAALEKVGDQAKEIIQQSMGEQLQQIAGDTLDNMVYNNMKMTFYIDKKSFEQKKLKQEMSISLKQDDADMTIDSKINIDSIQKYDKDIVIPEDVKKNAQKVSFDQLQEEQAQQ